MEARAVTPAWTLLLALTTLSDLTVGQMLALIEGRADTVLARA